MPVWYNVITIFLILCWLSLLSETVQKTSEGRLGYLAPICLQPELCSSKHFWTYFTLSCLAIMEYYFHERVCMIFNNVYAKFTSQSNIQVMIIFYCGSIESVLTCCICLWFSSCTMPHKKAFERVINMTQKNNSILITYYWQWTGLSMITLTGLKLCSPILICDPLCILTDFYQNQPRLF